MFLFIPFSGTKPIWTRHRGTPPAATPRWSTRSSCLEASDSAWQADLGDLVNQFRAGNNTNNDAKVAPNSCSFTLHWEASSPSKSLQTRCLVEVAHLCACTVKSLTSCYPDSSCTSTQVTASKLSNAGSLATKFTVVNAQYSRCVCQQFGDTAFGSQMKFRGR